MLMAFHVHQTCRICYYHLEHFFQPVILDKASSKSSGVLSSGYYMRLDFAHALLFSIADIIISHYRRVQHYTALLVVCCDSRDHINPVLKLTFRQYPVIHSLTKALATRAWRRHEQHLLTTSGYGRCKRVVPSCLMFLARTSPHRVRGAPRGLDHPSALGLKV